MKSITQQQAMQVDVRKLLKASLPSYLGPLLSAGLPAYFLGKEELLRASYTTIGIPSLVATILCFLLLSYFQHRQILIYSRFTMLIILGTSMLILALAITFLLGLQSEALTIGSSAFLGATIISLTKPLKRNKE